jgi:predicted dithiol-disulfide oxidoreductase (DUF899 family)
MESAPPDQASGGPSVEHCRQAAKSGGLRFRGGRPWRQNETREKRFRRLRDGIFHFWGSELPYVPVEPGQVYRHNDLLDPVWNMFDLAPEGGADRLHVGRPTRMQKQAKG